jgi:hypothetical protein
VQSWDVARTTRSITEAFLQGVARIPVDEWAIPLALGNLCTCTVLRGRCPTSSHLDMMWARGASGLRSGGCLELKPMAADRLNKIPPTRRTFPAPSANSDALHTVADWR